MRIIIFVLLSCSLFFFAAGTPGTRARTESDNYIIWADVFSVGGVEGSSSSNYLLSDTLGESEILSATSTSSNYGTKTGFRELYPDQFISLSLSASSGDFGTLSTGAVSSWSHTMTIDTNSTNGFTITVSGDTLTSGSNTIIAIGSTAAASAPGTSQFGINVVANTSPAVGANPIGTSPIGSAASPYGTANYFAYTSGSTVASATSDINETTYTVSYIANIATGASAGTYQTTLTYSATTNF